MKSLRFFGVVTSGFAGLALIAAAVLALVLPPTTITVAGALGWWLVGMATGFGFLAAASFLVSRAAAAKLRVAEESSRLALVGVEAQLRAEADDERARLLGRIDHELKNPLTALRISLHTASAEAPATMSGALANAMTQTDRIARLVHDMRKIGEIRTRQLDLEQVDLEVLLDEVRKAAVEANPEAAAARRWSIQVQSAPWPLPPVTVDLGLIFLAVHNLVENAVKYSDPGDLIELRASDHDDTVVIEVADTGMGIPPQDHAAVWQELARSRVVSHIPGSGLGLPLVAAIAARHAGRVELRSREGSGTVMRLIVPAAGPAVGPAAQT